MKRIVFAIAILVACYARTQPIELKIDPCSLPEKHIPDTLGHTPVKRLRLVLHIFAKADSSGNFRNKPEDLEFIQTVFNHMMWHYRDSEILKAHSPAYYHIKDSRIRPVIDTLLFHYDDDAWNFKKYVTYYEKKTGDSTGYNLSAVRDRCNQLHQKFVKENKLLTAKVRDSALHIFFLEAGLHRDKGMAENLGSKKWAYFAGTYHHYVTDKAHWGPGQVMAHEIGHALGLGHVFDYSGCADLPRTPKGSTNNFMDTYPGQGRAISPCQMGQMHKNLLDGGAFGDIHHTLINDWCHYHPDETMNIRAGDTVYWKSPHYLWGDLVIENGAVLVVKCEVSMPPGAEIRIKKHGALIIDRGIITQKCNGSWAGIKLESRKKLFGIFKRRSQAVFELRNGGRIEKAKKDIDLAEF